MNGVFNMATNGNVSDGNVFNPHSCTNFFVWEFQFNNKETGIFVQYNVWLYVT